MRENYTSAERALRRLLQVSRGKRQSARTVRGGRGTACVGVRQHLRRANYDFLSGFCVFMMETDLAPERVG